LLPHANLLCYLLVFDQPLEELVLVEMVRIWLSSDDLHIMVECWKTILILSLLDDMQLKLASSIFISHMIIWWIHKSNLASKFILTSRWHLVKIQQSLIQFGFKIASWQVGHLLLILPINTNLCHPFPSHQKHQLRYRDLGAYQGSISFVFLLRWLINSELTELIIC
jgi:hypothetical protein